MKKEILCTREQDGTMQIITGEWKVILRPVASTEKVFSFIYEENNNQIDVGDLVFKENYKTVFFTNQRLSMGDEWFSILQKLIDCLPIFKLLESQP